MEEPIRSASGSPSSTFSTAGRDAAGRLPVDRAQRRRIAKAQAKLARAKSPAGRAIAERELQLADKNRQEPVLERLARQPRRASAALRIAAMAALARGR